MLLRNTILLLVACLAHIHCHAQLAITEVMSSGSTSRGAEVVTQKSDYWELTNFGPTPISLDGYKWDDGDFNFAAADPVPFQGLFIGAGESIVFVQTTPVTTEAEFRAWWGAGLSPATRVVFYNGNGFSSNGDAVILWSPTATAADDFVDRVDFGAATRGFAFVYDTTTGEFGTLSVNGSGNAFKAEQTDDIGSPGKTSGPTTLRITQDPDSRVVNPGETVIFQIAIQGRPRGTIQWYHNDQPMPNESKTTLTITDAQTPKSGRYYARVNNGSQSAISATAELVMATEATVPAFLTTPAGITMTVGQSFTFSATASGSPMPELIWQLNGQNTGIAGNQFTLSGATADQSGEYSVIARNSQGSVTNKFNVSVTQPPRLVITEVMSSAFTTIAGHGDYWELTNLGDFPVNLYGYRFDDNGETLGGAVTFTNEVTIAPGESVIFVENMTPEAFKEWWGADNLPANLDILTYRGNGLSSAGDAVNVWNAAATEDSDKIASAVFSTATSGVSFGYDPDLQTFGDLSTEGVNGAIKAANGGDVGSPGAIRNGTVVARPRITGIRRVGSAIEITFASTAGVTYRVDSTTNIAAPTWALVNRVTATGTTTTVLDNSGLLTTKFYRLVRE